MLSGIGLGYLALRSKEREIHEDYNEELWWGKVTCIGRVFNSLRIQGVC